MIKPDLQAENARLRKELEFLGKRDAVLAQIDTASSAISNPDEIIHLAAQALCSQLAAHRCVYAEVKDDLDDVTVICNFVDGLPPLSGSYSLRQFLSSSVEVLTSGRPFVVEDSESDQRCMPGIDAFRAAGIRSTISYPLMENGRLRVVFAIHSGQPRKWNDREVELVATVAVRCRESIARERALREAKADRERFRIASERCQQEHAQLQAIYDTAPIGLAYFDPDEYRYRRLNERQAAFYGLTPSDLVGKTVTEMTTVPEVKQLFDRVARGESIVDHPIEGTLVTDPAAHRYWVVSYFPVYAPDGTVQGIAATSQEVTQQKKAEKALIQAEKLAAVGRLAASMAHEINNPLEAVMNLIYLARSSSTPEQAQEFLKSADDELLRISAITSQTLRFHRQATKPQLIDTAVLFSEVLGIFQARFRKVHPKILTRLRGQSPIRGYHGEIRQVLANLVGNALDAMTEEPKRLFFRTREATLWSTGARGILITIGDTGCGIRGENVGRIFEPFFTTKGIIGTGLGLWVAKEIVERHHGVIRFRSCSLPDKHGSVFSVFIPLNAELNN